jgi:hypothetical protein
VVIKKTPANTYSVLLTAPEGQSLITLKGTLRGDTLHLQHVTSGDWPVYLKRAGGGLDEMSGDRVVTHLTKQ